MAIQPGAAACAGIAIRRQCRGVRRIRRALGGRGRDPVRGGHWRGAAVRRGSDDRPAPGRTKADVTPVLLAALVFVPMLLEAWLARRNEQALLAQGAREPSDDVFAVMRVVYPLCFISMIAEGWLRGRGSAAAVITGMSVFAAAKLLKYWAVAALGPRWSFRVLVPPNSSLVTSGPYRYLQHPNYVAVVGELVAVALMAGAPLTGLLAVVVFGLVLIARVRTENRALGIRE